MMKNWKTEQVKSDIRLHCFIAAKNIFSTGQCGCESLLASALIGSDLQGILFRSFPRPLFIQLVQALGLDQTITGRGREPGQQFLHGRVARCHSAGVGHVVVVALHGLVPGGRRDHLMRPGALVGLLRWIVDRFVGFLRLVVREEVVEPVPTNHLKERYNDDQFNCFSTFSDNFT